MPLRLQSWSHGADAPSYEKVTAGRFRELVVEKVGKTFAKDEKWQAKRDDAIRLLKKHGKKLLDHRPNLLVHRSDLLVHQLQHHYHAGPVILLLLQPTAAAAAAADATTAAAA